MYNAIERYKFIIAMTAEGVPEQISRLVLRDSTTLDRLAEAMCNGDYPCDNGERTTRACTECELGYAPASLARGVCPECRAQARITKRLKPYNVTPIFSGDPRGHVVKLEIPSGKTTGWGQDGIGVPV